MAAITTMERGSKTSFVSHSKVTNPRVPMNTPRLANPINSRPAKRRMGRYHPISPIHPQFSTTQSPAPIKKWDILVNSVGGSKRTAKLSNKEIKSRKKSKKESTILLKGPDREAVVVSSFWRKKARKDFFETILNRLCRRNRPRLSKYRNRVIYPLKLLG